MQLPEHTRGTFIPSRVFIPTDSEVFIAQIEDLGYEGLSHYFSPSVGCVPNASLRTGFLNQR